MGQVVATFTGVESIKSVVAPRTLGVLPNSVMLTCVPQQYGLPASGALTIYHGSDSVTMRDMRVDWAERRLTTSGHVMTVKLVDRRWRWKFLLVSGKYNIRLADGTIDPASQKTTHELAVILLQAMQETQYDIAQLPNTGYPEVDWTYEMAAHELERICQERGCDIALNIDDSVSIVRNGTGMLLPDDADLQSASVTGDPPEMPGKLILVCGETLYESRLELEPVGVDTDGEIKPIDDLTYKPPGGWATAGDIEDMEFINKNTFPSMTDEEVSDARQLATQTVFRWYRIKQQADGSQNVPGYGDVDGIDQLLPINDYLLDTQDNGVGNKSTNKRAEIFGTYVPEGYPGLGENTEPLTKYRGGFRIIKRAGIVIFTSDKDTPVYKYKDVRVDGVEGAKLYLQTSYGVRTNDTKQQDRHVEELALTGNSVLQEAVRIEEIAKIVRAEYGSAGTNVTGTTSNESEVSAQAQDILAAMAGRYAAANYATGRWRGIKRINVDGAIRQVVFYASDNAGVITVASRNAETYPGVKRYGERRRRREHEQNTPLNVIRRRESKRAENGVDR